MPSGGRSAFKRSGQVAIVLLGSVATLGADQTVTVGPGMVFSPATVTVAPGEAVIWSFQELHSSTSDAITGPEVWDSGLSSSGTFSHTFQTAGTYPYHCTLHSFPGGTLMNGVVNVVGAGVTATPSPTATPEPTAIPASPTPGDTPTPLPTSTPTETPIPPILASPSPTPLPVTTSTPIPAGPTPAGIPLLDPIGRAILALALAAAGITALSFAARR